MDKEGNDKFNLLRSMNEKVQNSRMNLKKEKKIKAID